VTAADRAAIGKNDLAEAIRRLAAVGHGHRIWPLLDHLAETVPTAGQLALVTELAEDAGYHHLAVMAAKEGQRRGLAVGRLAYPTKAIPRSASMPRGLDRALVYAIARQESLFNEGAVSPAGARGLMQVMPRTAAAMARELGISHSKRRLVTDPAHNATIGAAYLAKRLDNFGGSYILTFAAYNAGAGRVAEWIERFGDPRDPAVDPIRWVEEIPFPETRNYVMRVMENVQVYREALGTGGLAIATDLARGRRG
jgi:soluble lytic murein transglycosylase